MTQKNIPVYGGQAVIEGVMFAGQTVNVTAVRRKNKEIEFFEVPKNDKKWVKSLKKIPMLRGIIGIIDASAKGSQHLTFSAEAYAEDEEGTDGAKPAASKKEADKKSAFSGLGMVLSVAVIGALSFAFGFLIFNLVPVFVENFLFANVYQNQILHNLVEGIFKIILLLTYLYFISTTPLIKRLFQYHGAEHKVISCYEAGLELNVRNVQKFNTLHFRCGSSFIILTVILGVIIYSFVKYDTLWERILERILLLPIVIGASYETLKFTNSVRNIPVLRALGYPGLWLQLFTTRQPNDEQVEVAIASFNRMMELDREKLANSQFIR